MEVITTHGLCKTFGDTVAASDISISVNEGQIFGFLGLNGAGKTTLIRMLLGMVRPDAGEIHLLGRLLTPRFDGWNDVGYLVETPYSYPNLTVKDNLEVHYALRRLRQKGMVEDVMERLKLTKYRDARAGTLSLGNQQRLGLAKALIHKPRLLILDEPINGLDPEGIVEVRELLAQLAAAGTTVFISSHILEEISKIAHEIAIIHQGRLMTQLSATELSARLHRKLRLSTRDNDRAAMWLQQQGYACTMNAAHELEVTDSRAIEHPEWVSAQLSQMGIAPSLLYPCTEDLEMFFLRSINHSIPS